jgi:hypothetical protein
MAADTAAHVNAQGTAARTGLMMRKMLRPGGSASRSPQVATWLDSPVKPTTPSDDRQLPPPNSTSSRLGSWSCTPSHHGWQDSGGLVENPRREGLRHYSHSRLGVSFTPQRAAAGRCCWPNQSACFKPLSAPTDGSCPTGFVGTVCRAYSETAHFLDPLRQLLDRKFGQILQIRPSYEGMPRNERARWRLHGGLQQRRLWFLHTLPEGEADSLLSAPVDDVPHEGLSVSHSRDFEAPLVRFHEYFVHPGADSAGTEPCHSLSRGRRPSSFRSSCRHLVQASFHLITFLPTSLSLNGDIPTIIYGLGSFWCSGRISWLSSAHPRLLSDGACYAEQISSPC